MIFGAFAMDFNTLENKDHGPARLPQTVAGSPSAVAGGADLDLAEMTDATQDANGRTTTADDRAAVLHKSEFLDRVSTASNVPRAQVRRIVEATLAELGRALAQDGTVVLPPFGTARVRRRRATRDGEVVLVRLRRNTVPAARRNAQQGADPAA